MPICLSGDSIENNGNNNPLCLPGEHSLEGKTTGSYFCEPLATGKYVNIRQTVPDKAVALAEIAVYSEASRKLSPLHKLTFANKCKLKTILFCSLQGNFHQRFATEL